MLAYLINKNKKFHFGEMKYPMNQSKQISKKINEQAVAELGQAVVKLEVIVEVVVELTFQLKL